MRLLHLTDDYSYTGGIRSYLSQLSAALMKRGHEVEIFSPAAKGAGHLSRWLSPGYYRSFRKALDRFRPDLVHAHSLSMRLSPLPLLAARERGLPVVMTIHDFNYVCPRKWGIYQDGSECRWGFGWRCLVADCPSIKIGRRYLPYQNLRWLKIALHRLLLRRYVNLFICPSEALRLRMSQSLGLPNIVHLPNFLEEAPAEVPPFQGRDRLLFVGRLSREKGVDCLLEAMPAVLEAHPGTVLTLAGDGPERPSLEHRVEKLGLGEHVRFAGMVDRRDLPAYYAQASLCLMPSPWMENCPMSGLEALAHGRPLVGSDIGGIPEIIQDGLTGLLHRRGDPGDLAEKIIRLLGDGELMETMSQNAHRFFRETFSEEQHLDRISRLYRLLVP